MKNISIFGTSSDAGKSTITFIIAKILQDLGYKITPFKAQNVSNNSKVCDDKSEIAIAQYFQAEVLNIKTSYHLNPILLKSGLNSTASLIVEGKVISNKNVREYYRDLDLLKPSVNKCFEYLNKKYDCIICEGAGSPVELNLMDKDLSNIYIAKKYNTKIILVADIEKGGVFASIWGVYNLLPKKLKKNIIGVIINKFRGDLSLFDDGIKIIENDFKIPVLGILPYIPFNLGFEDSASLKNFEQKKKEIKLNIAIISYPTMSNYNDFEPLIADNEVLVEFVNTNISLEKFDLIILPGSKLVQKDLLWLKQNGLFKQIKKYSKNIFGICGGYQMMFKNIKDKYKIEFNTSKKQKGFSFIEEEIIFKKTKILKKQTYFQFKMKLKGFEIHYGVPKNNNLQYFDSTKVKGTFIHGVFDNNNFRTNYFKSINPNYEGFDFKRYKNKKINTYISKMKNHIDIDKIKNSVF